MLKKANSTWFPSTLLKLFLSSQKLFGIICGISACQCLTNNPSFSSNCYHIIDWEQFIIVFIHSRQEKFFIQFITSKSSSSWTVHKELNFIQEAEDWIQRVIEKIAFIVTTSSLIGLSFQPCFEPQFLSLVSTQHKVISLNWKASTSFQNIYYWLL